MPKLSNGQYYELGTFLCLDGPAKIRGEKPSKMKVCFTACNQELLRKILSELATEQDCYWVKLTKEAKDTMFLGRCFFTTSDRAGEIWARFKSHPRLMVNLQDDDFASKFRKRDIN